MGQSVHKIGRTTGWTRGSVSGTCVNVNVSGTNITQLCQTLVSAGVGAGGQRIPGVPAGGHRQQCDAGGHPVGRESRGSSLYVFSPISNIETELGALTTF